MARPKKDEFADLDKDFKDTVANMDEVSIRKKVSEVALNQVAVMEAKKNDEDLAQKKEAYSVAGEGYKEVSKMNKLRIAFCRRVLSDKNKEAGSYEVD